MTFRISLLKEGFASVYILKNNILLYQEVIIDCYYIIILLLHVLLDVYIRKA